MSTLGDRIKILRGDLSQAEFADMSGVSQRTIGHYEKNERQPDAETIKYICSNFNVSADWLLFGKEPTACGSEPATVAGVHQSQHVQHIENTESDVSTTCDRRRFYGSAPDTRELERELLGLYKDKVSLLEEVASLKERNRQLEEQLTQAVNAVNANNAGMIKSKAVDKAG